MKERRATVSGLSRSLNLSKSTILYHLLRLSEIGFVKRVNDGYRNWIYYELSEKGKSVIKRRKIGIILFGSSLLSFVAGILQVKIYITSIRKLPEIEEVIIQKMPTVIEETLLQKMPSEAILYSGITLIFVSALLFAMGYAVWRKHKSL